MTSADIALKQRNGMADAIPFRCIADKRTRTLIVRLLNLVEDLSAYLRDAQAQIRRLHDEVNRLKGEQGKPDIKPPTPPTPQANYSSKSERHRPVERGKHGKRQPILHGSFD